MINKHGAQHVTAGEIRAVSEVDALSYSKVPASTDLNLPTAEEHPLQA